MEFHARTKFRCSACFKLFKCAEGLVAHCESNGKCPIQKHDDFDKVCKARLLCRIVLPLTIPQMLDEITGGFLKARKLPQAVIYRQDKAVVKLNDQEPGLMPVQYKAKMPGDPWSSGPKW